MSYDEEQHKRSRVVIETPTERREVVHVAPEQRLPAFRRAVPVMILVALSAGFMISVTVVDILPEALARGGRGDQHRARGPLDQEIEVRARALVHRPELLLPSHNSWRNTVRYSRRNASGFAIGMPKPPSMVGR